MLIILIIVAIVTFDQYDDLLELVAKYIFSIGCENEMYSCI